MAKYTVDIPVGHDVSESASLPVEVSNHFYDGIWVEVYLKDPMTLASRSPCYMKNPFREYMTVYNPDQNLDLELEIKFRPEGYFISVESPGDASAIPELCVVIEYEEGLLL